MYSVEEKEKIINVSLHMSTVVEIKKNDIKTWKISQQMWKIVATKVNVSPDES